MEIYEEYYLRHKMVVVCPYEKFINDFDTEIIISRPNPQLEIAKWKRFLQSQTELLIQTETGRQLLIQNNYMFRAFMSVQEQQDLFFRTFPNYQHSWNDYLSRNDFLIH